MSNDRPRPTVLFDFSQGNLVKRLPPLAVTAMINAGLPVRQLASEMRGYLHRKALHDVAPYPVMKIITKYVDVVPTDFASMEAIFGREARTFLTVPSTVWWTLDYFEDHFPKYRWPALRKQIIAAIESMTCSDIDYYEIIKTELSIQNLTIGDVVRHQTEREQYELGRVAN